jgi:hypothetical protein
MVFKPALTYISEKLASGLLYNLATQTYRAINFTGAISTELAGISGSTIVGYYEDAGGNYESFLARPSDVSPTPISGAVWLLGLGLVGLIGFKRLNRRGECAQRN